MLAGQPRCSFNPSGGWLAMIVLVLVGVQTAFFVPAKYGILPEILPHERLSAGNGLLEMTSNLASLAGIDGGGFIVYPGGYSQSGSAPMILAGFAVIGLAGLVLDSAPGGSAPKEAWERPSGWRPRRSRRTGCCVWP